MEDDRSDLVLKLRDRNIQLGQPIGMEEWKRVDEESLFDPGVAFKTIYSKFDGFLTPDYRSQLTLWPLSEIIRVRSNRIGHGKFDNENWVRIGDFLIESDYIIYRVRGNHHSVKMLMRKVSYRMTLMDFWINSYVGITIL